MHGVTVRSVFTACLPQRTAAFEASSAAPTGKLDDPTTLQLPRGMRKKKCRLTKLPGFRYSVANSMEEVDRLLTAFWIQEATRFSRQGIRNIFDDAGIQAFIRDACVNGLDRGKPGIALHALEGGGEVLAIAGLVSDTQHCSVMFNSITTSDFARPSPGIILIHEIISDFTRRGASSFDLGAGPAPYKSHFCPKKERRRDGFVPFSMRGHVAAVAYGRASTLRRAIKANAPLMKMFAVLRQ